MLRKLQESVWTSLLWTILIFTLLIIPQEDIPGDDIFNITDFDKIVHAVLFGVFVWLWCFWYRGKNRGSSTIRGVITIVTISCLYGIGMEFFQKYFTDRQFDNGDIIADVIGSVAGGLVFRLIKK